MMVEVKIEPLLMMETRLLWMNCNMFQLLTPMSMISTSLLSGFLAKIIAPITEVIALISSSLRLLLNDVLITEEYKEYKPFRLLPLSFD